jgi:hypothetical protein
MRPAFVAIIESKGSWVNSVKGYLSDTLADAATKTVKRNLPRMRKEIKPATDAVLTVTRGHIPGAVNDAMLAAREHIPRIVSSAVDTAITTGEKKIPGIINNATKEVNKRIPGVIANATRDVEKKIPGAVNKAAKAANPHIKKVLGGVALAVGGGGVASGAINRRLDRRYKNKYGG